MDSPIETGIENTDESSVSLQRSNSFVDNVTEHINSSSPVTPERDLDTFESDKVPEVFNSGSGSSEKSPTHDSDSSSSEFDSETEAFYSSLNHRLVSPGTTMDTMDLDGKQLSYGELITKLAQCEEELKTTSQKLEDSELEIEKLKNETKMSESGLMLAQNLRAELETTQRELETRNKDIDSEKRRVLELEKQVAAMEIKLSNSSFNIENLTNELKGSRECEDVSNVEISKLREMLCDSQQSFSTEKTILQTEIADLLDQIKGSDAEKEKMRLMFETKEIQSQAQINSLKTELTSRDEHIEALNKDFDNHKLSFNMLMAEKDGVNAELDDLKAELRSKDIQIEQMEEFLNQSHQKHKKLEAESEANKNTVEELKAMVKGLEKLLELQRKVISEGEEEKREVIRQLCFSLDHYRTGYKQLLRFLSSKNKQQTIIV